MTEDTAKTDEHSTEETGTAVAEHEHAGQPAEPFDDHFRRVDIDQFSQEDTVAGTAIGKMLALFFLYTVIVMSLSALWTFANASK